MCFIFQQDSALTYRPHHCPVSQAGNTRSNRFDINPVYLVHYLRHCPIECLPFLCVQNVNELKQHLLTFGTAWKAQQSIIGSAIYTTGSGVATGGKRGQLPPNPLRGRF